MGLIQQSGKTFLLENGQFSYAFGISAENRLIHLHYGAPVRIGDLPEPDEVQRHTHTPKNRLVFAAQEYPAWGGAVYTEPALKVTRPDGVRNILPVYQGFGTSADECSETLRVDLLDSAAGLEIRLFWRVYKDSSLMDRRVELRNIGNGTLRLESVLSAAFQMPRDVPEYRLTSLAGRWANEGMIQRQNVPRNRITLESRTGLSGPFAMPFFALDDGCATERDGRVWFGTLQWSGNWKITAEQNGYGRTLLCAGLNDFDFEYHLPPGQIFRTPVLTFGYAGDGFSGMTLQMHRHIRAHVEPEFFRGREMPLIANTYASFGSGPEMNEAKTLELAEAAARIGVELFVFDAGWQKALGDWTPHPEKFPNGIRGVRERVRELGMKFGVWVELESLELHSDLYAAHPDWIMNYPDQALSPDLVDGTNPKRILLNLAKKEVADYLFDSMDRLISDNDLDYLKLDMNRAFTAPGWPDAPPEKGERAIWFEYVRNLYSIFERIQKKYPALMMENCAEGNHRADWRFQRYFSRVNRSDNQDSLDILKLHEGFSFLHLPKWAGGGCHISDYTSMINGRIIPLRFQAYAGMLGSLAVGKRLTKCSPEELDEIREYGELYKKLRRVIHNGDFYRIVSHHEKPYAVYQYVSPDRRESVVFFFAHALQFATPVPPVRLAGLEPERIYTITAYGGKESFRPKSGQALEALGVQVLLRGDFDARILHLTAVP